MKEYKFAVMTVAHTGTNFIHNFFLHMGCSYLEFYRNHFPAHDTLPEGLWTQIRNIPVITTARDPYLTAFHHLSLGHDNIDAIVKRWELFLNTLPSLNSFVVDVGCSPKFRNQQLFNCLEHCKIDVDDNRIHLCEEYARKWKAQNSTNNTYKKNYLETGELPDGYGWSLLDQAVEWYKGLPTNDFGDK